MTRQEADSLLQLLLTLAADLLASVLRVPSGDFGVQLLWWQCSVRYGTIQSDLLSIPTGDRLVSLQEMVEDIVQLVLLEPHGRAGTEDLDGRFWID